MGNWVEDVILKWESEGVEINRPATIIEIENTEANLGFKFPADFKEFYLQANGFTSFSMQKHLFSLWRLEVIVEEFGRLPSSEYTFVGFSEFLLASHYIGFSKDWPGIFNDYNHAYGQAIAYTFTEFIKKINLGDKGLHQ